MPDKYSWLPNNSAGFTVLGFSKNSLKYSLVNNNSGVNSNDFNLSSLAKPCLYFSG